MKNYKIILGILSFFLLILSLINLYKNYNLIEKFFLIKVSNHIEKKNYSCAIRILKFYILLKKKVILH